MRTLKNGNMESRKMGHTSSVRPILEYASAGWDPCRLGQIEEVRKNSKEGNEIINKGYSASSNPPEPIETLSVRRKKPGFLSHHKLPTTSLSSRPRFEPP